MQGKLFEVKRILYKKNFLWAQVFSWNLLFIAPHKFLECFLAYNILKKYIAKMADCPTFSIDFFLWKFLTFDFSFFYI